MARLDETNLRLLQALQRNARSSLADLAAAVGKSESTVRERLLGLESSGILRGYDVHLDWDSIGLPVLAIVRAHCDLRRMDETIRLLAGLPNVTCAVLLTGPKPVEVTMRVRDVHQLDAILQTRLIGSPLSGIEVEVVLQSLVHPRSPALPGALGGEPSASAGGGGDPDRPGHTEIRTYDLRPARK